MYHLTCREDVDKRLQQAKQETERKVSAELKFLHTAMQEMDKRRSFSALFMLSRGFEDAFRRPFRLI